MRSWRVGGHSRRVVEDIRDSCIGCSDLVTSYAHVGLCAALRTTLNSSPWQRCQFLHQQNAQAYVSTKDLKQKFADKIRRIFNAEDRPHAEAKLAEFVKTYEKRASPSSPAGPSKTSPEV